MSKNLKGPELLISASGIKTYESCARKYYYTYVDKLPKKDWAHFDIGTLVHGTLEKFHTIVVKNDDMFLNTRSIIKQCFQEQKNEMKSLKNDVIKTSKNLIISYFKSLERDGMNYNIVSVEEGFNIKLNERYSVRGFIDRIDIDEDGVFHIKDYKTTKSKQYMDNFQLRVYGIHLLDKNPSVEWFRASYIMMKFDGELLSYKLNKEDVEKTKDELIRTCDQIQSEEKWTKKVSKLCEWCDFKSTCFNQW